MAKTADRALETSVSTGAGNITLAGAATGYRTFNAALGVGVSVWYAIELPGGSDWETGVGHLSDAVTLVRDSVLASSNAGALVTFGAGTKNVFATYPAAVANNPVPLVPTVVYISPAGNDVSAVVGDPTRPFATILAAIAGRGAALTFHLEAGTYAQGAGRLVWPAGAVVIGAGMVATLITFSGTQDLGDFAAEGACCIQPALGVGNPIYFMDLSASIIAYAACNSALIGAENITIGQSVYPDIYMHRCKLIGVTDVVYASQATLTVTCVDCLVISNWDIGYVQNLANIIFENCHLIWQPRKDALGIPCNTWAQINGNGSIRINGGDITYNAATFNTTQPESSWMGARLTGMTSNARFSIGGGFRRINKAAADAILPFYQASTGSACNLEVYGPVGVDLGAFAGMSTFPNSARIHTMGGSLWMAFSIYSPGVVANRGSYWIANAAALVQIFELVGLPPQYMVEAVSVYRVGAMAGTPATATIEVGISGNTTKYLTATDIKTTGAIAAVAPMAVEAAGNPYTNPGATLQAKITTTGANVAGGTGLSLIVMVKLGGMVTAF